MSNEMRWKNIKAVVWSVWFATIFLFFSEGRENTKKNEFLGIA